MKKILIFSHAMELGGAERALLGLLEALDYSKISVDLFLMRHSGELMSNIPKEVNLLPENPAYSCMAVPIGEVLKKGQFMVANGRRRGKKVAKRRIQELGLPADNDVSLEYSHKYTVKVMPPVNDKMYDLAISFLTPHYYVAEKVQARQKVAWIHTDYTKVAVDRESQLLMWQVYDNIVAVSESVASSFQKVFPELAEKLIVIKNMLPVKSINKQSFAFNTEKEMPEDGSIRILSIGRFCYAKNFDSVPKICKLILEAGCNVKWYLIGYGGSEDLIRQRIQEEGMEDHVIILGKKENPYPYIMNCDYYVQPSRYEGYSVSVREAQALAKPVIITAYETSTSQLQDGIDGVIVPLRTEDCANSIIHVLNDQDLTQMLISNCKKKDYSGQEEVAGVYKMLEVNN